MEVVWTPQCFYTLVLKPQLVSDHVDRETLCDLACRSCNGNGCIEVGVKCEPFILNASTVQVAARLCQQHCVATDGCVYYSWWSDPVDGNCQLHAKDAKPVKGESAMGVVSGEAECDSTSAEHTVPGDSILSASHREKRRSSLQIVTHYVS